MKNNWAYFFISSVLIFLFIYTTNVFILAISLIIIIFGMIQSEAKNRIEFIIFFSSWIYVLKFDFNQFSMFLFISIFYILINIYDLYKKKHRFNRNTLLVTYIFLNYIFIVSMTNNGEITSILGLIVNYLVLFIAITLTENIFNFNKLIKVYVSGLIASSFVGFSGYFIEEVYNYIELMTRFNTILVNGELNFRFAGLDLDPNYFAEQVLFAIVLLTINMYIEKNISLFNFISIVLLISFGVLSFSKMFILTISLYFIILLMYLIIKNIKAALKVMVTVVLFGSLIYYTAFEYLYKIYFLRFFGQGISLDSITTGRSDRWDVFINEISNNIQTFVFGQGYGTDFFNNKMPHNMYLTMFYYFGLIGILVFLVFLATLTFEIFSKMKKNQTINIQKMYVILLIITLIMNLSLDSIVMDFFPIQLYLLILSFYSSNNFENINLKYRKEIRFGGTI